MVLAKADTTEHLAKAAPVNSNTIAVTRNMGLESLSEIEMQHYAQASASRRTGGPDMMD